jgi:hypothetical protein
MINARVDPSFFTALMTASPAVAGSSKLLQREKSDIPLEALRDRPGERFRITLVVGRRLGVVSETQMLVAAGLQDRVHRRDELESGRLRERGAPDRRSDLLPLVRIDVQLLHLLRGVLDDPCAPLRRERNVGRSLLLCEQRQEEEEHAPTV